MPNPIGRPGIVITEEIEDAICDRLIAGESMDSICRDPGMPSKDRVYVKIAKDERFRTKVASAREAQQDALAEQTLAMAMAATPEDWQLVKMQIWAHQWYAGKLAPKRYGDRQAIEHSGGIDVNVADEIAAARKRAGLKAGDDE